MYSTNRGLERRLARRLGVVGLLSLLGLMGCESITGAGKGTPGNRLSKVAEELRNNAASPQALPTELEKQTLTEYIVEPGDVLRLEMADLDSAIRLPADQTVMIDGRIDLGTFGRLPVAGSTIEAVEKVVQAAITAKNKDAGTVNVRLVTADSKTFFVLGEVNAPGEFVLTGRETVLNAIVRAGGVTANADVKEMLLSRPTRPCECRRVLPVCYKNIVQIGDTSTNYQLRPGDRVFVPRLTVLNKLKRSCMKDKNDPCEAPQNACPAKARVCPPCACAALGVPGGSVVQEAAAPETSH